MQKRAISTSPHHVALLAVAGAVWWFRDELFHAPRVRVTIRLDRDTPGAHLMWDVTNVGEQPVTITKLIVHGRQATNVVPLTMARLLQPQDGVLLPTDVDWSVMDWRLMVGDWWLEIDRRRLVI